MVKCSSMKFSDLILKEPGEKYIPGDILQYYYTVTDNVNVTGL